MEAYPVCSFKIQLWRARDAQNVVCVRDADGLVVTSAVVVDDLPEVRERTLTDQ